MPDDLTTPENRTEDFLAAIAGLADTMPSASFTRLERYLKAIGDKIDAVDAMDLKESTTNPGCFYRTVDNVDYWLNPPLAVGTEYATMERFLGKVVYVTAIECYGAAGSSSTPANNGTAHEIENIDDVVSVYGTSGQRTIPYHMMISSGTVEEWIGITANATYVILSGNHDRSTTKYTAILRYTKLAQNAKNSIKYDQFNDIVKESKT